MKAPRSALALIAAAVVATAWSAAPPDRAEGQRLRAQIFLTQQRIPGGLNERALVGFGRRARTTRLQESTSEPIPERKWHAEMIVNFNTPPGDLEFHVLFYDTQDRTRNFVEDMAVMLNSRSQKTFVQRIRLERPRFRPNRRMELVVTVRRQEVGTYSFQLYGQEVERSGRVDFSTDDTRARDE